MELFYKHFFLGVISCGISAVLMYVGYSLFERYEAWRERRTNERSNTATVTLERNGLTGNPEFVVRAVDAQGRTIGKVLS